MHKRSFALGLPALALLAPWAINPAAAQDYPARPITVVVPHPAGGSSDILARQVSVELGKLLKQSVLVENKAGANGTIAARYVASAPADGYTLLLATASTHGINPTLYRKLSYDAVKDFAPVTLLATVPNVLVVSRSAKTTTLQELVQDIRAKGDKANMGSAGAGTPGHLAGEMFKDAANLNFTHVPYKGGAPAITDLIGGQIDFMFTTIPGALAHLKAGALRPIAVTSPKRAEVLPEVPTVAESGLPGFQALSWHGVVAPVATPPAIVTQLHKALSTALATPEVKARLAQEGASASGLGPEEFRKYIVREVATWGKAVKDSGATAY